MNGFERSKAQLNVNGVPQSRVQDLGADLMGLFGSVEKGVNTYAKIGEQTASIDARDKINSATREMTLLQEELIKYEEVNDTQGILNVKSGINSIVAGVKSYSEEYKDNIPAQNKFNSLVDEWGTSTLSKLNPALEKSFIGAYKNKLKIEEETYQADTVANGVAVPMSRSVDVFAQVKAGGLGVEVGLGLVNGHLRTNLSLADGHFEGDKLGFIKEYKLIKDNKYNPEAEAQIMDTFFPHFKFDEEGNVLPKNGELLIQQSSVTEVEKFFGKLRSTLKDDKGNVHNPQVASDLAEVQRLVANVGQNDLAPSAIDNSKAWARLQKAALENKDEMGEGQFNAIMTLSIDVEKGKVRNAKNQYAFGVASDNPVTWGKALATGYGDVPAEQISKMATKYKTDVDAILNQNLEDGDVDGLVSNFLQVKDKYSVINKGELPDAIQNAQDMVSPTSNKFTRNSSQAIASIAINSALVTQGFGIANPFEQKVELERLASLHNAVERAISDCKKNGGKNCEQVGNDAFLQARTNNNQEFTMLAKGNRSHIYSYSQKELDSTFFNLGTTLAIPYELLDYIASDSAKRGYDMRNKDSASKYLDAHFVRESTGIFGDATIYPKDIEKQYEKTVEFLLMQDGIKYRNQNFPIFVTKDVIGGKEQYVFKIHTSKEVFKTHTLTKEAINKIWGKED